MTDLMERTGTARPTLAGCKGKRHTPSHDSWRLGCRCEATIYAHKKWLKTHPYTVVPAAVDDSGACVATKHNSVKAYLYAGCRCPRSVTQHAYTVRRREEIDRRRHDREYWAKNEAEIRWVKRVTGGRLEKDPRKPWRGGKMAVDRNALFFLMRGAPDRPTRGELMAAVAKLSADRPWMPGRAWYSAPHRMLDSEMAEFLGCTPPTISRLRRDRMALPGRRAQRRLADARWRAAVAAYAPERKAREAELRERAAVRAEQRRVAWKQHCRTMRRLRESQARAKLVALAIERHATV